MKTSSRSLVLVFTLMSSVALAQVFQDIPSPLLGDNNGSSSKKKGKAKGPGASLEDDDGEPRLPPPPAVLRPDGSLDPFGSNLFMGNFLRARQFALNPEYVIMPGDHIAVHSWGAVQINEVFVVDGQGNIFLPEIGPVRLAGVRNRDLTETMNRGLKTIYTRSFQVYTNLLSSSPVAVFVTGGVNRPGRYAGIPSDSLLFFLDQAGGIDAQLGSFRKIVLLRKGQRLKEVDLYDFILKGELATPQFADGDVILVEKRGPVIELRGNVASPALLEFHKLPILGREALDVIPGSARATQVTVKGVRSRMPIARTMSMDRFATFELFPEDSVELRDDGRPDNILVRLEGEFDGPSLLSVRRGARLVDVLNTVHANEVRSDVDSVHIRRASVAVAQKDAINDSLFRLERSALLALSGSRGEAEIRTKEAELTQHFVERARLIQPLGRVVTSRNKKQVNIILEDGDVVQIPAKTNIVRVGGEVMMSQALMYEPGWNAGKYIEASGGYSDRGDNLRVLIMHANAEVTVGSPRTQIVPGDEILVPPRVDTKVLQGTLDITQIIYQIAVATGVVLRL